MDSALEDWLSHSPTVGPESAPVLLYDRLKLVAELLRSAPPGGGVARLVWRDQRERVVDLSLTRRIVVGREASCDLAFADSRLSRRHCAFERDGEAWKIINLKSTNGTRVNGRNIDQHLLRDGDLIELGQQCLAYLGVT